MNGSKHRGSPRSWARELAGVTSVTDGPKRLSSALIATALIFSVGLTTEAADRTWATTTTGGAWLSTSNWSDTTVPGSGDTAVFTTNPTTTGNVGINFNSTTNNGTGNQIVGAIAVDSSRSNALNVGNSTTARAGTLTFAGQTINSVNDVILRNNSSQLLTLVNSGHINAGNRAMAVSLGNTTENVVLIDSSGGITISSTITSSANRLLTLDGAGSGALTLSAANTYTGTTRLTAGTIRAGNDAAFGNSANALLLNGGTVSSNSSTSRTFAQSVTLGGNVAFGDGTNAGILTFSGAVGMDGGTRTVTTVVTTTFSGAVTNGSLTKAGTATLALTNASNNFGTLTVNAGTASIGANTAITGLEGSAGSLNLSAGTLTLTPAASGTVALPFNGSGGFTKAGSNTLWLTGNSSTYAGTITVSAGALVANGNLGGSVSVSSGATLMGSGTVGSVTVTTGATLSPGNSPGVLTTGNITWEQGGNYNWQLYDAALAAGTGYDTISGGTLTINATSGSRFNINLWTLSGMNPDANGSALNFNSTQSGSFTLGTFASISGFTGSDQFDVVTTAANGTGGFANSIVGGAFTVTTSGNSLLLVYTYTAPGGGFDFTAGTANWNTPGSWAGGVVPSGTAAITFSGPGGTSTNDTTGLDQVSSLTFTGSATGAYTVDGNAITLGVGGIVNNSTFTQTVAVPVTLGTNASFTANTGTLVVSGTLDTAGFSLSVAGNNATSLGVVNGAGLLTKAGSGTATLTGAVATTSVTVSAGSLTTSGLELLADTASVTVSSGAALGLGGNETVGSLAGAGSVSLGSNTLTAGGNGSTTTFTGIISGSGGLTKQGAGTFTLGGTNTYSGATVVSAGTLSTSAADILPNASAVSVASGAALALGGNDTVGSFAMSGGSLNGSGNTLTAATYSLNGGTVAANLGAGTATASSGSTALNGTLAGDLTVSGGTVSLGAADRISGASIVTVASGSLDLGAFADTVGSFTISGGALGGSGTLTASTYALQGGTVAANLGAGKVNVSVGTTSLSSAGRLAATAEVNVSSGQLTLGGNETVSTYTQSGGALGGSATLTAGTYAMTGGTVNANLGGGTLTANSGATTIAGTVGATTITISGGSLNLSTAGRLSASANVTMTSGALTLGGNETVSTYTQSGGTLNGPGVITASSYSIWGGTLNTTIGTGSVAMTGGSLTGSPGQTIGNAITIGSSSQTATPFVAYWDMQTVSPTTTSGSGISFGSVVQGNNNGSTTLLGTSVPSSGYTLASGTSASGSNNAGAAAFVGAINPGTSTYFAVTLTGSAGYSYSVVSLQFGSRSTATGPQGYDLRTGMDSFGTSLGTGALSNNSTWGANQLTATATTASGAVEYRLYGVNGTGTPSAGSANWRIDDLRISGTTFVSSTTPASAQLGISSAGATTYSGNVAITGTAELTAVSGGTATFSGAISGSSGAISKTGAGTVVLSGLNTYGGGVNVSAGTLLGTTDSLKGPIANAAAVIFDQSTSGTYAGAMSGAGSLAKLGTGTVALTSAQSFTGPTTISSGALALSGTANLASSLITLASGGVLDVNNRSGGMTLADGQTLAGTGTVSGLVVVGAGATVAPGSSPGTLNAGSMEFAAGGNYNWQVYDLNGPAGTGWDFISGTGSLNITAGTGAGTQFNINLWSLSDISPDESGPVAGFNKNYDYRWKLAEFAGGITGFAADEFLVRVAGANGTDGFANDITIDGVPGTFSVAQGNPATFGTVDQLYIIYVAAPEPSTLMLAGLGLAAAGWTTRRRRASKRRAA
jgi:fibronectin-binding autotransporter adhesin